jgi:hypothetical protein
MGDWLCRGMLGHSRKLRANARQIDLAKGTGRAAQFGWEGFRCMGKKKGCTGSRIFS